MLTSTTIYKIASALDREGNVKILPSDWTEPEYTIYRLQVGRGAILIMEHQDGRHLHTSTVEDYNVVNGYISITTKNTVYNLKPVGE